VQQSTAQLGTAAWAGGSGTNTTRCHPITHRRRVHPAASLRLCPVRCVLHLGQGIGHGGEELQGQAGRVPPHTQAGRAGAGVRQAAGTAGVCAVFQHSGESSVCLSARLPVFVTAIRPAPSSESGSELCLSIGVVGVGQPASLTSPGVTRLLSRLLPMPSPRAAHSSRQAGKEGQDEQLEVQTGHIRAGGRSVKQHLKAVRANIRQGRAGQGSAGQGHTLPHPGTPPLHPGSAAGP
jgi:hypothetical protein